MSPIKDTHTRKASIFIEGIVSSREFFVQCNEALRCHSEPVEESRCVTLRQFTGSFPFESRPSLSGQALISLCPVRPDVNWMQRHVAAQDDTLKRLRFPFIGGLIMKAP